MAHIDHESGTMNEIHQITETVMQLTPDARDAFIAYVVGTCPEAGARALAFTVDEFHRRGKTVMRSE